MHQSDVIGNMRDIRYLHTVSIVRVCVRAGDQQLLRNQTQNESANWLNQYLIKFLLTDQFY